MKIPKLLIIILFSYSKVFGQKDNAPMTFTLDKSEINFEAEWEKAVKFSSKLSYPVVGTMRPIDVNIKDFNAFIYNDSQYYEFQIIVNKDFGVRLYFDTIDRVNNVSLRILNGSKILDQRTTLYGGKISTKIMIPNDPYITIQIVQPLGFIRPLIHLNNISYYFYDYINQKAYKKSALLSKMGGLPPLGLPVLSCHNDVNCGVGPGMESEASSVALIVEEFKIVDPNNPSNTQIYPVFATGFLVNQNVVNTSKKAYLITAHHTIEKQMLDNDNTITPNPANWEFYFNYDAASCGSSVPSSKLWGTGTGRVFVAAFPTSSGYYEDTPRDLLMLELNITMAELASHFVCLSGWDAPINNPIEASYYRGSNLIGIHHPGGAMKKISQTTNLLQFQSDPISGHKVWFFDSWSSGATEGGSSGSPLYNGEKKVMGVYMGRWNATSKLECPPAYQGLRYCPFFEVYAKNYERNWIHGLDQYLDPNNYTSDPVTRVRSMPTYCPDGDPVINPLPANPNGSNPFYLDNRILGQSITPDVSIAQADPKTCRTYYNDFDNSSTPPDYIYTGVAPNDFGVTGNGKKLVGRFFKNPVGVGVTSPSPLGNPATAGYMGDAIYLSFPANIDLGTILGNPLFPQKVYAISFYAKINTINGKMNVSYLMFNFLGLDWQTSNPATPGALNTTNILNFNAKNKYGGLVKVMSDEWQYFEFYVQPPILTTGIVIYTDWGGVNYAGAHPEYNIGEVVIDNIAICESCVGYENKIYTAANYPLQPLVIAKEYISASAININNATNFRAGSYISLEDGFESTVADFTAEIVPCYANEQPGTRYTNLSGVPFYQFGKRNLNTEDNEMPEYTEFGKVVVYPNPSVDGLFTIEANINSKQNLSIELYSINGTIISENSVEGKNGSYSCNMNLSNQAPGVYYAKVFSKEGYSKVLKLSLVK